jgi:hypothetical protein
MIDGALHDEAEVQPPVRRQDLRRSPATQNSK